MKRVIIPLIGLSFSFSACCSEARGCVVPIGGGGTTVPSNPPAQQAPMAPIAEHPEDPYWNDVEEWPFDVKADSYADAYQECADLAFVEQSELISVTDNGDGTYTCKIRTWIRGDADVRELN